jgi:hypothetical protein
MAQQDAPAAEEATFDRPNLNGLEVEIEAVEENMGDAPYYIQMRFGDRFVYEFKPEKEDGLRLVGFGDIVAQIDDFDAVVHPDFDELGVPEEILDYFVGRSYTYYMTTTYHKKWNRITGYKDAEGAFTYFEQEGDGSATRYAASVIDRLAQGHGELTPMRD